MARPKNVIEKNSLRVACQDAGDESGDLIIELPADLLNKLGWSVDDQLTVEKSEELIALKLKQKAPRTAS
nr:AbrB/MazE/SpoVT family DNA-binding domain-containing protein [Pseudomonas benzenivorans]